MRQLSGLILFSVGLASSQDKGPDQASRSISLTVPAGAPLRLYLTKKITKRLNAPVQAKTLAPLYSFDREVVPSGTEVLGIVSRVQPVSKLERTKAMIRGDFTPLRIAEFEFTSIRLSDGRQLPIHTVESMGLNSFYPLRPPKTNPQSAQANNTSGVMVNGKQLVKDQIDARMAVVKSIPDMVRGPGKKDMLYEFLLAKLPYHPQYIRARTRLDAELRDPLDFGSVTMTQESLSQLGSQPAGDSMVHARLLTPLDSKSSSQGQKVEAVLAEPLFSDSHKLVLPEGTRLDGSVVLVKKARWFHHAGRLRFNFDNVELPPQAVVPASSESNLSGQQKERTLQFRTQAILKAAESGGAPIKVDGEGGVQATESKTRFIGLAVSAILARNSGLEERHRNSSGVLGQQGRNSGGRLLGGGSGFGLLGSIAAQSSPNVGLALGYYGLAWSIYSTVIARGPEAEFLKNAAVDIGFNVRKPVGNTKVK